MPFQKGHTINKGRKVTWGNKISKSRKGMKFTKEHIKNLSKSHIGYKMPRIQKDRIAKANKGKKHPHTKETKEKIAKSYKGWNDGNKSHLWCGRITECNKLLRTGRLYRRRRKSVFERDDYTCQQCGEKVGRLNADHIKPFSLYPKLRFDIDNGRTLCEKYHKGTDTYGYKSRKLLIDKNYKPDLETYEKK